MKKIRRYIIEFEEDFFTHWTREDFRNQLNRIMHEYFSGGWKVKEFNAVMARERKKGKREKTRFQAGR